MTQYGNRDTSQLFKMAAHGTEFENLNKRLFSNSFVSDTNAFIGKRKSNQNYCDCKHCVPWYKVIFLVLVEVPFKAHTYAYLRPLSYTVELAKGLGCFHNLNLMLPG